MSNPDTILAGGVLAHGTAQDNLTELRALADELARLSFEARIGQRGRPAQFDDVLWQRLEDTGLTRLTSTPELSADPAQLAVVLHRLAYHAAAVPLAETDLLAMWIGSQTALKPPTDGPMTVAIADATADATTVSGTALAVPWFRAAHAAILVARTVNEIYVGVIGLEQAEIVDDHNLAGEPRERITFTVPTKALREVDSATYDELIRRGAWARCVQVIGALDAAAALTVAHCRQRTQFGRPLSKFQSVQQSLAEMAGEIERGRAATELAVVAAADHGFGSDQADYAITVAKVVLGRISDSVVTIAHQLHGAIGVTIEYPLWLATTRAQSWIREFGSTRYYAQRLGERMFRSVAPWDVLIGRDAAHG